MRGSPLLIAALVVLLAGCASSDGTGRFALHVTDAPDDIGDFSFLNVTVSKIELTAKDGGKRELDPATATFDLTKLVSGNTTTLFNGTVPVGNFTRLDLSLADALGTLQDGSRVEVQVPSGRIFLNTAFEIAEGQETSFLFDIQVNQEGNGDYALKPNADGSGPNKKSK